MRAFRGIKAMYLVMGMMVISFVGYLQAFIEGQHTITGDLIGLLLFGIGIMLLTFYIWEYEKGDWQ